MFSFFLVGIFFSTLSKSKDTQLSSSLSSEDKQTAIVGFSHHVESEFVSKENGSVSEGADWLNTIPSTKLTANRKPGGGKRKRDGSIERDSNNIIILTKKRRGEN